MFGPEGLQLKYGWPELVTQPQLFLGDTSPRVAALVEVVLKDKSLAKKSLLRTGF